MNLPTEISTDARAVAEWLVSNHTGEVCVATNEALINDIAQVLMDFRVLDRKKIAGLTPQEARVLAFLSEEEDRGARMPSFDEISRYCAIPSKNTVHKIVHALADRGAIKIEPGRARSIVVMGRAA